MSDIGKIIRVNALPPLNERENNVIYQVAAPGAATYKDYAIDTNGDLKTPSYIPLTGTEEGKPLTKNIEVDPSEEGSVGFISNTPGLSEAVLTIQEDDSVFVESRKDTDNTSSSIHLHHDTGVEISATTSGDQFSAIIDVSGLQGNDYVTPTSDEHYVQKKYITDNFTSQTTLDSTLANYYTKPETYSKTEVDAKFSAVYRPKGSVANFAALPASGNTEGDVWNVLDTGANYLWVTNLNSTGVAGWDKLSETVDLTNYVTINTYQEFEARKVFRAGVGNRYDEASLELRGSGSTIYPTLSFHSPGLYAGTISLRGGSYHFKNGDDNGYVSLFATGFVKDGSDNNRVLLAGGGDKLISDFVLTTDLGNYWAKYTVAGYTGINAPTPFGFLNGGTAQNAYMGGLLVSNAFQDETFIPTNGAYIKGTIATSIHGNSGQWNAAAQWVGTYGISVLNDYVPIIGDSDVNSIKNFTGAYTQWALDGDGTNNARGFAQSLPGRFLIGTLNDKDFAIYRNSTHKIIVEDALTTFETNIAIPNAIANNHAVNLGQLNSVAGNYVPIIGDSNVEDIKRFTGSFSEWVLDNDEINNAHGFIQSASSAFYLGTLNSKPIVIYQNGNSKISIEDFNTSFANNITVPSLETSGGGRIDSVGNLTLQQSGIGGNATGIWWNDMGDTDRIAGIGVLTNNGVFNYAYMGWGNTPWEGATALIASDTLLKYKGNTIWHEGNFNPNNYIPYTGATTNIDINSKNLTTTAGIYAGFFSGSALYSPVLNGSQVINANNANLLIFGNDTVSSLYYGAASTHAWYVNGITVATMTALGLAVTGAITGFEYHGNIFASPVTAGAQVFNANNANFLLFGNDVVPDVYYSSLNNHTFVTNGVTRAVITNSGLAVTGTLSLNGQNVATENYVSSNYIPLSQKGVANGIATLDSSGLVPSNQLPSYVDDVLEFANLASFPVTGESGKIYVAIDTNLTYRWSGSNYIQIASGAVQSVNGQTGVINLSKTDIGLTNVDNTSDATKNVLSATKWATPRTLSYTGDVTGSASVDGSGNVGFAMTLANSGVSAGTYNSVNVDAKGRVLSGSNVNYITESYLTDLLQQNYFNQSASDERFVNAEGDEVINGNKTFTSSPSIPTGTHGDHAVNLEQLTSSLSTVINDSDSFKILEEYRLIDSNPIDLNNTDIKKYNIVFDGSSNGSVNINHLRDNQYYQFSNVSGSGAELEINVEGYGLVDTISSGKTAVYMSWGGGKLLRISANENVSII